LSTLAGSAACRVRRLAAALPSPLSPSPVARSLTSSTSAVYTNTPPELDSAPTEHDLRVHFRILGTVQGGNARTVLVRAFDSLFTFLRTYMHEGGAGLALLTPVLPTVAPDPGLLHRTRRRVQHVSRRMQDPQGTFKQTARHLTAAAASNPFLGLSLGSMLG